jgi:hypothetical protein
MNSQDFRNLQEAYLDVYYELDEGRGDDLRTKHGLKPGEVSTKLSKRAEIKALNIGRRTHFDRERSDSLLRLSGLSKERSQGETPAGNSRWNSEGQLRDIRSRGGRPSNRYDAGVGRDIGDKGKRFADFVSGKRDNPNMTDSERRFAHHNRYADPYAVRNEQVDLYNIILSHLLDEGYAETPEQAEVIMVNMSEDWRESIVEGRIAWDDKKNPNPSGYTPAEKNKAKIKQLGVNDPNKPSFEKGGPGENAYARHASLASTQDKMDKQSKSIFNKPKGKLHKFSKNPFWDMTKGQVNRMMGINKDRTPSNKRASYGMDT